MPLPQLPSSCPPKRPRYVPSSSWPNPPPSPLVPTKKVKLEIPTSPRNRAIIHPAPASSNYSLPPHRILPPSSPYPTDDTTTSPKHTLASPTSTYTENPNSTQQSSTDKNAHEMIKENLEKYKNFNLNDDINYKKLSNIAKIAQIEKEKYYKNQYENRTKILEKSIKDIIHLKEENDSLINELSNIKMNNKFKENENFELNYKLKEIIKENEKLKKLLNDSEIFNKEENLKYDQSIREYLIKMNKISDEKSKLEKDKLILEEEIHNLKMKLGR
ncbi:uncharacterized protein I206_103610 [Kwoniella pini CBS 10737]|uniref:Uncharacterized protein n=1 Tax=Kwoniella pini CBS 10737 TaxID=1296096 RepID=A0A1B9I922_9TREE|nr:uncharacterized protein I206_01387 [Kwoniella pini CBS 10737]OCF52102.1 hypothetical protein I206_01387 [Kwoniella pini CBS 10737]